MEQYDRRTVFAPAWMENFICIAGDCPDTCCQQWDIDVDTAHAQQYQQLDDPELQSVMDRTLRSVRVRRPGTKQADTLFRLRLLSRPDRRCPFLSANAECRLQKKYGASILCDTCYFHPRSFWEIDDKTCLSACLSCPECARLALLHDEPTVFTSFETEIDPGAEWLETELITDPEVKKLLRRRDRLIASLCGMLQNRKIPIRNRVTKAIDHLLNLEKDFPERGNDSHPGFSAELAERLFSITAETMEVFIEVFDPISGSMEKPAQSAAEFMRRLAGGETGYAALLAENCRKGAEICSPFLTARPWLMENLLVHCVFSDSFKQFTRYQNDPLTVSDIMHHEAALLTAWYCFFHVRLSLVSLEHGDMNESIFLKTVMDIDRNHLHYPDWFARCADRLAALS